MKKKLSLVVLLVLITSLVGCGHIEQNVKLNHDGSGTLEIIEAFLQVEDNGLNGEGPGFDSTETQITVDGVELVRIEPYEIQKKDGLYVGTKSLFKFESLVGVEGTTVTNNENSTIIKLEGGNNELEGMEEGMEELMEAIEFVYSIEVPGDIIKTNGKKVNTRKVSWNSEYIKSGNSYVVEYKKDETSVPVVPVEPNKPIIKEALKLQEMGLLKGTEKGLELERTLTRAEGASMIKRLKYAIAKPTTSFEVGAYQTPEWDDVPNWAKKDVFELGQFGIIKGVSNIKFEPNKEMKAIDYTTMVLRLLGYKDTEGDFTWEKSLEKAVNINLITIEQKSNMENKPFTRENMAIITYNAINLAK